MAAITLRFFAAARSVAGTSQTEIIVTEALSIQDALERTRTSAADYDAVMGRCSFLVNAVSETDRLRRLSPGDVLDVLPPFAGG